MEEGYSNEIATYSKRNGVIEPDFGIHTSLDIKCTGCYCSEVYILYKKNVSGIRGSTNAF
jgi:hypothetical protein